MNLPKIKIIDTYTDTVESVEVWTPATPEELRAYFSGDIDPFTPDDDDSLLHPDFDTF